MRIRSSSYFALVLAVFIAAVVVFLMRTDGGASFAQEVATAIEPMGGGEFENVPRDMITDEQRRAIQAENKANIERLTREGKLPAAIPQVVPLSWPVRKTPGVDHFFADAISNYVDQNPAFPNQVLDWNCGSRTYDQASGYNHAGIDVYTWPFSWHKMDNDQAEVIAAAPGTIINKTDGNFDRNCGFGNGNWNAIYVRHSDNSVAWYGHMKSGSLNPKVVGNTVVAGERLGVIGSSGNSTGPHLHFELYNSANQLQDPFQGTCNTINNFTWWATQEPYRVSRINRLITHSAAPAFNTCPTTETPNEKRVYKPGDTLITAAYFRDQQTGQATNYVVLRPDGLTFQSWSHNSPNTYSSSYWFWTHTLPTNAPRGVWKFRATYNTVVYEQIFLVGSSTPADFDGDAKTDLSIFRPTPGEWWWLRSSNGTNGAATFGNSADRLVPADFTGDGKSDIAIWRPSNGNWFVLRSEDFSFYAFPFGSNGDVPAPADFDADGKADAAVFRESAVTWYINKSSGGTDIIGFGAAGDKPVNADYDGDGKSDIAIFRPNGVGGAEWWVRRSSNASVFALQFGTSTDKAVPGDFTGDGKADVAFWRPATGFWNVLRSEDLSYYAFPFGANGDIASPGDYDGDGKLDAAVFRPSNSTWYANRSTAGTLIQQFGITGDVPVPNAFVR